MSRAALACMVHLYRNEAGVLRACLAVDVLARPVRRAPRGKSNCIQRYPDGSCSLPAQLLFRALGHPKPLGVGAKQSVLVVHEGADPLVSLGLQRLDARPRGCGGFVPWLQCLFFAAVADGTRWQHVLPSVFEGAV